MGYVLSFKEDDNGCEYDRADDCEDVDDNDTDGGIFVLQHRLFLNGWQLVHRWPDIAHLHRLHRAFLQLQEQQRLKLTCC